MLSRKKSLKTRNASRSYEWHRSIKKHYGNRFHDKLERCLKSVERKSRRYPVRNKYAICFSSLKKTTNYKSRSRKRNTNKKSKLRKRR